MMGIQIKEVELRQQTGGKFGRTRIHFFVKNETVLQDLENRHERPYNEYRKHISDVLKKVGINPNMKARWSQKAGCKCGCSPAFILDENWGNVIYVTIA